jgi:hypothetical protein
MNTTSGQTVTIKMLLWEADVTAVAFLASVVIALALACAGCEMTPQQKEAWQAAALGAAAGLQAAQQQQELANQERLARASALQSSGQTTVIVQPNIGNGGGWVPGGNPLYNPWH